jgi:enediyne biosynthesis protein E4
MEKMISLLKRNASANSITFIATAIFLASHSIYAQNAFVDVTKEAGINHQFKVYEGTFGGGVAVFDFNNDGWEDLFITGGLNEDMLYLNKGNGTFENVYNKSGLATKMKYVTQGAVSADVNKDGWRDLYVTTITTQEKKDIPRAINLLYINKGDGTFRDATTEYGLDNYLTFSTGAMFGDVNLDGYPDLYVGNYFQQFDGKLHIMNDAIIVNSKQMADGLLLINKKGNRFENMYQEYGLDYKGFGFGGVFSDYDNDGDLDVIVNHDFGYRSIPNKFLQNQYPRKRFLELSDSMDMDLPINAMGTAVGDYNNDGLMDYYITNIRANPFMVNQGAGKPFINMNEKLGIMINMMRTKEGGYMPISWGANFGL